MGAIALAEGLKVNRVVRKLYLNDNCIGKEGVKALMDVKKSGVDDGGASLLQIISLRRNNLDEKEEKEGEEFVDVVKESCPKEIVDCSVVEKDGCKEEELIEKSPKSASSPAFRIESSSSVTRNKTNHDGASRTTAEDTNMSEQQQQKIEIDALIAERKLMMQQLNDLSTTRDEARDELAAKDAVIRRKEEQILVQRKQLAHYESEVNEIRAEHKRMIQQLHDKLSSETVLAAARVAAKDAELKMKDDEILNLNKQLEQMEKAKVSATVKAAELKVKCEEMLNLHKKELDQIEAARVAAENKAIAKEAELSLKNHLVVMNNELEAKVVMGQKQSKQLVDKFTVDIARMKSREVLKDAELKRTHDLLKTKDEEILIQRKQLEALVAEIDTKETELKKKHEELLDHISSNEKLRESSDEMERQVEQLSAQNAEMAAVESNLKKMNEDLSSKNSHLTSRVDSLSERLKYSKAVDLVDLTTETAEAKRSGEQGPKREELPSKKRRRITNGVAIASNDTTDDEGSQNVENIAEATQRTNEFEEVLEKYKTDIVGLLRQAASKGEKDVSVDAVIQTRRKHVVGLKRAYPLISDQGMITAFSKADSDANGAFIRSLRQNRGCAARSSSTKAMINLE